MKKTEAEKLLKFINENKDTKDLDMKLLLLQYIIQLLKAGYSVPYFYMYFTNKDREKVIPDFKYTPRQTQGGNVSFVNLFSGGELRIGWDSETKLPAFKLGFDDDRRTTETT